MWSSELQSVMIGSVWPFKLCVIFIRKSSSLCENSGKLRDDWISRNFAYEMVICQLKLIFRIQCFY